MNKRLLILCGLGVVILLLVGWWFWGSQSPPPAEGIPKATNHRPRPNVPAPNALPPKKTEGMKPKDVLMKEVWAIENARSQEFYGKVVDQYGQPVVGADVTADLMFTVGFDVAEKIEKYETQTNAEGLFQFTGLRGARITVAPSKFGYELGRFNAVYRMPQNVTKTSPEKQCLITMWKLKGAEPMVHTEIQAGLACDGTPRSFDVMTGKRDAGGLVAVLTRNPVNIDRGKPFDWTLTLGIAGGGLIEIKDAYPNEAPADGYQPVAITMPANTKNWTPSVVQSYYFFDGKNYGRVTINIMANYQPPPTHVEFEAYVNPSGSRNLEYDPAKQIKP